MAENNVIEVVSDPEPPKSLIEMGDVGHTLSDSSSDGVMENKKKRLSRKRKWVPKLVVEKRSVSSSDNSDKENSLKKNAIDVSNNSPASDSDSDGKISPLYQNQLAHPKNQFWQF